MAGRKRRKKRLSLRLRSRRLRGIILSTEMMLLLTAVIMFVVVAAFGMSRMVLSQAMSQKTTLVVIRANAWTVSGAIAASLYLQNTGSVPVSISGIGIKYTYLGNVYYCLVPTSVTINPGEAKVLSSVLGPGVLGYGDCSDLQNVGAGQNVYVYVKAGSDEIGTAVTVTSP